MKARTAFEIPVRESSRMLLVYLHSLVRDEPVDGATLYLRGTNQYVMTVSLNNGLKRTSGCDGQQSWARTRPR